MRRLAFVAAVTLAFSHCGGGGLSFRIDDRVEIVGPKNLSTVTEPVTVRWRVNELVDASGSGDRNDKVAYFAVLVDKTPMPPGEDVTYFARDDEGCLRTPECPDQSYLAAKNVFLTTDTSLRIEGLADTRPGGRPSAKDAHEITIVLLDRDTRRIGEASYSIKVFVDRSRDS